MITYLLIGLSFILIGVTGLQFTYMFYVDRLNRERKKYIRDLERRAEMLSTRLEAAETRIAGQDAHRQKYVPGSKLDDEAWADVLDER